jgi:hypothetical protein
MQTYGIDRASESQNDVTPALPAGWAMVELTEQRAEFGLLRMQLFYSNSR